MTVTAPPTGPRELDEIEQIEALIEEARRRTRRRRRSYAACALLAVLAGAGWFFAFRDGDAGGSSALPTARDPQPRVEPVASPFPARNGPLTLMAVREIRPAEGPSGWYGVSTVDADGRLRLLAPCPRRVKFCGEVESIDWSPNGRWLALAVSSFGLANPYNGIHAIEPASGTDLHLRDCGALWRHGSSCSVFELDWSPDGSRLAYVSNGKIFVIKASADSGEDYWLQTGTSGRDYSPSWSSDGRWIAYAAKHVRVPSQPPRTVGSSVYVIGANGLGRRLLAPKGSSPAWSPDGSIIAYRRGCGIRFMTPAGQNVTPLTLSGCIAVGVPNRRLDVPGPPTWSPDGHQIAFSIAQRRWNSTNVGTYVINRDGSGLRRLTAETIDVHVGQQPRPAWRPIH
jgi:hypothetical protein